MFHVSPLYTSQHKLFSSPSQTIYFQSPLICFQLTSINFQSSMNFHDIPTGRSPNRELQGPRPTPLRINKDSHKIKKPPLGPQPQAPPRQPVIIYTVSPKVIHTTPSDFMNLVQRLTGSSSSSSSNKVSTDPLNGNTCRETTPQEMKQHQSGDVGGVDVVDHEVEWPKMFHGVLSPAPASSMSLGSSSLFSPSSDPSMVRFLQDLSPVVHHGNRNFVEGNFIMQSPSNFVSPGTPSIDLFNNFSN